MEAFRPCAGTTPGAPAWSSRLQPWERALLADAAEATATLLDPPGPQALRDQPVSAREGESAADAWALAALDFTPSEEQPGPGPTPRDPALERLLPDASEDPETATELRGLLSEGLRDTKRHRLRALARELYEPTGPQGTVLVTEEGLTEAIGAVNDVRLVLAERLSVTDAASADAVHGLAATPLPEGAPQHEHDRQALAVAYEMLTWWQESLLTAVMED